MNFNYISLEELCNMHKKNRQAIIVFNVHTKDISEYINNCIITLSNNGFNTNLLTNPRVLSNRQSKNKNKIIVLQIRYKTILTENQRTALKLWSEQMGNVGSLSDFFNNTKINELA